MTPVIAPDAPYDLEIDGTRFVLTSLAEACTLRNHYRTMHGTAGVVWSGWEATLQRLSRAEEQNLEVYYTKKGMVKIRPTRSVIGGAGGPDLPCEHCAV